MLSPDDNHKENSSENLSAVKGEPIKPKTPSKAIRLLTVIAYVLSVSMAAIFLSIYYIFIWKDKTLVSALEINDTTFTRDELEVYNITIHGPEEISIFSNETISDL